MRVSEMKDPVIVWDCYREAYWRENGCGYTGAQQMAGIFERQDAPKGNADRKIELLSVPTDHSRFTLDQLLDARARVAELEAVIRQAREYQRNIAGPSSLQNSRMWRILNKVELKEEE